MLKAGGRADRRRTGKSFVPPRVKLEIGESLTAGSAKPISLELLGLARPAKRTVDQTLITLVSQRMSWSALRSLLKSTIRYPMNNTSVESW